MEGIISRAKNVEIAEVPERLSDSSIAARWVDIQAKLSNTNNIFIGDSTVSNSSGIVLSPGATITMGNLQRWFVLDLSQIGRASCRERV